MMATLIETVWKQAIRTFPKKAGHSFEDNFKTLKSLADRITSTDVNLDLKLLDRSRRSFAGSAQDPPVTYIEIYEDKNFTIGIFILRPGMKIPLHDHPGMHGILKVIAGSVRIQSYTMIEDSSDCDVPGNMFTCRLAEKLPELQVSEEDDACVLTPTVRNLHEVRSVNGSAAFVDILAPPYDTSDQGGRSCHYYIEVPTLPPNTDDVDSSRQSKSCVRLMYTPSPPEFWCDAASYAGPELRQSP